jgi:hypothetical protein
MLDHPPARMLAAGTVEDASSTLEYALIGR